MSLVDPISDMLTRIRNSYAVGKASVSFPTSKLKESVLVILKAKNYIGDYQKEGQNITVELVYNEKKPAIEKIERISRPGRRVYVKKDEIPVVLSGRGTALVSTSKGIMTGEVAKSENMGGEVICKVY
jgi:small subunit ribosomal protein S8